MNTVAFVFKFHRSEILVDVDIVLLAHQFIERWVNVGWFFRPDLSDFFFASSTMSGLPTSAHSFGDRRSPIFG